MAGPHRLQFREQETIRLLVSIFSRSQVLIVCGIEDNGAAETDINQPGSLRTHENRIICKGPPHHIWKNTIFIGTHMNHDSDKHHEKQQVFHSNSLCF